MPKLSSKFIFIIALTVLLIVTTACSSTSTSKETDNDTENKETETTDNEGEDNDKSSENEDQATLTGKLKLDKVEGEIGDKVKLSAEELKPNEDLSVVYVDMEGEYSLKDDNYSFSGLMYNPVEEEISQGTADKNGEWSGEITVPEGFGDDHDILIYQNDEVIAKANFFVETVFKMSPESGPIGTEIEIVGEGLSPKMYGSIWHLNYDNAYTGMITGVSTKGKAKAVIRASGNIGDHMITIESGSSGSPYLSRDSSAINYISTQYFTFEVTDDEPKGDLVYVEDVPEPASGGIQLPDPEMKENVTIKVDKDAGTVDEEVTIKGTGLPKTKEITFDWHTMVGNRVTPEGFSEDITELGKTKTNEKGEFSYTFPIPDDLGGLEHLIDVKVNDDIYGQTYLRILPSVASITPSEGPPGTLVTIEIKGSGWTEFDNALAVVYDNAYNGYVCGFESQGTVKLPFVASGDPGYHLVDIYPSIYQGKMVQPNIYLKPQLTYRDDHPGTGMPAIRTFFKVTEE